jgi:fumarylacetoacetate (FAA) hydrolase family protein
MDMQLDMKRFLPDDGFAATLIGRAWVPGEWAGPSPVVFREDGVYDLSRTAATVSALLDSRNPVEVVRAAKGSRLGSCEEVVRNSVAAGRDPSKPWLLAPCDLQVVKASGVTFADSLLERVIEEQARGDAAQADAVRKRVTEVMGADLRAVKPGSPQADRLKSVLIEHGLWSQYLEVGIGPDAEVFTKAPVLSSVGTGAEIGIHAQSAWNNPEPEIVLAVDSRGNAVGATLGNDVNLRDFEGRSALLLGKAKDNNASCAIGPFIRLFDAGFSIDDVRSDTVDLLVEGPEGFTMRGASSMARISRDPLDLVVHAMGAHHQYPDGMMLFLGTMFAPTDDRAEPGSGFTHRVGDVVTISSPRLGSLVNQVNHSDKAAAWTFGLRALIAHIGVHQLPVHCLEA